MRLLIGNIFLTPVSTASTFELGKFKNFARYICTRYIFQGTIKHIQEILGEYFPLFTKMFTKEHFNVKFYQYISSFALAFLR